MIIDVQRFIDSERHYWNELETILKRLEQDPYAHLSLSQLKRFHYLYERTSADLGKITTFGAEREITTYLESLVARAYGEIHESRQKNQRFQLRRWFLITLPQTFRKHANAFLFSSAIMLAGFLFGGAALLFDPESKPILIPFSHLQGDPSERVEWEENTETDYLKGQRSSFSAMLMTHNTRVSIFTMALGMTWGIGTILMLFYNGVILGAVALDYVLAGEAKFLLGWLLPHGAVEIPSLLISGQAGFVIARTLIGKGSRMSLRMRFREAGPDLVTLIGGVAVLLIWAGIVESFLSQYHEPVLPYEAKIAFGLFELVLLVVFLLHGGRVQKKRAEAAV